MKPELKSTNNYNLFEMHENNRPLHDTKMLMASMQEHGFMPSGAIHCQRMPNGKLKVIRGHHRLDCAKRLKIPLWYIVDDTPCDIFGMEGLPGQNWSVMDFANAYSQAGNKNYEMVMWFKKKHGLPMDAAASLVGGEGANSHNKVKMIKAGTFKAGDLKHANAVASVTDLCRERGVEFATSSAFVGAVSKALRVPEFDVDSFKHKIVTFSANLRKRNTVNEYLDEIEALYNYGAKAKRMPVKFRALQVGRERQENFGGNRSGGLKAQKEIRARVS